MSFIEYTLQITDSFGNPCKALRPPYISNCNYSTAYNLLQHIYGDIRHAPASATIPENVSQ